MVSRQSVEMRTAKAAGILAAEMEHLQRYWEDADTDEMKALAAVAMLVVIPDGLETLRMQMEIYLKLTLQNIMKS